MKPLPLFTVFMPSEDTVRYCGKFMRKVNRRLGEDAFNHVIGWGPDPCALYPLMSPLFAHQGYSEFALRIQGLRAHTLGEFGDQVRVCIVLHSPPLHVLEDQNLLSMLRATSRVRVFVIEDDLSHNSMILERLREIE